MVRNFLILVASTLMSFAANGAHSADCRLSKLAALSLSERTDGSFLVPAVIAKTPVFLVLITSNADSSLETHFAETHGLPIRTVDNWNTLGPDGRKIPMREATIDDFALGGIHFKHSNLTLHTGLFPNSEHEHDGIPIVGAVGWNVLSGFDVELDLSHRSLNLFSTDSCKDGVVYWADRYDKTPIFKGVTGEIFFPMELDGRKLETGLGTGIATTTLRTDVSKKLYQFDEHSSDVFQAVDAFGSEKPYYRAMAINTHGLSVLNARIALSVIQKNWPKCDIATTAGVVGYTPSSCMTVHPLTLGRNVLSKLHLYIATKQGVMYFTAADTGPVGDPT